MNKICFWILLCVHVFACSGQQTTHLNFSAGEVLGIASKKIEEASGLAASKSIPGYLWTINDSGNPAEIYLLNEKAEIVMTCALENTVNRDWEELFLGPGPDPDKSYIYVADIGDNDALYSYKILYRVEEPLIIEEKSVIKKVDTFVFSLPDKPRDTEAMLYDSLSSSFYIFSKREPNIKLYELKYPFLNDTLTAEFKVELPFNNIVAADISAKGDEILLKNYNQIFYWKRNKEESFMSILTRKPAELNYSPEAQGESIVFRYDGSGFYTLSEAPKGKRAGLIFYPRIK
jgi:hypothetical protein